VVPSAHRHAFDGSTAGLLARIYVDPDSAEGRSLAAVFARNGIQAPPKDRAEAAAAALLATWGQTRAPVRLVEAARRALDALGAKRAPRVPLPPSVAKALDLVRARAAQPITPGAIAKEVGVPVAALRSALDQAAGLPFRNYLTWLRVGRAAASLTAGKTAEVAAREAGFAGAEELNRVFARLFGVEPAAILGG
jgi:AraC-like DNA-binding protein